MRVLCIAPAWNESGRIGRVVADVPRDVVDTVLVVDDGSSDDTAAVAKAAGAIVWRQPHNMGVGAAIRAGIDYGRQHGFDVAVVISGGGKTPPAQIPRLLMPLQVGAADFVQGSRYLDGGQRLHMPPIRRVGTRGYTLLFSALCQHWVTDASSGFRAFRLSLFDDPRLNLWQPWLDRYELEPYLLYQAMQLGYRVVEVPVTISYPNDGAHYTKMRAVTDWWRIFRPALFLRLGVRS